MMTTKSHFSEAKDELLDGRNHAFIDRRCLRTGGTNHRKETKMRPGTIIKVYDRNWKTPYYRNENNFWYGEVIPTPREWLGYGYVHYRHLGNERSIMPVGGFRWKPSEFGYCSPRHCEEIENENALVTANAFEKDNSAKCAIQ